MALDRYAALFTNRSYSSSRRCSKSRPSASSRIRRRCSRWRRRLSSRTSISIAASTEVLILSRSSSTGRASNSTATSPYLRMNASRRLSSALVKLAGSCRVSSWVSATFGTSG